MLSQMTRVFVLQVRFVGLSTALANPRDLSDWLGVKDTGLYNFRPSVRPIPCEVHIQVTSARVAWWFSRR